MKVTAYINRIRNQRKRQYARDYWAYLQSGADGNGPDYEPLSYMAAQGVRMTLQKLYDEQKYAIQNYIEKDRYLDSEF